MADGTAAARLRAAATDSAARLTNELVARFAHIDTMPDKVQWVDRQLAKVLVLATTPIVGAAFMATCRQTGPSPAPAGALEPAALDKLSFVDRVLAQRYPGPVFLPQVHALRETLSLHAVAEV